MTESLRFGRLITAMITPLDAEGTLDLDATARFVDRQFDGGVDAIIVTGTTGESPTLTADEKLTLYRAVVEAADGRGPVIANTGSYNTAASIELTKAAEKTGVDGFMTVVPYYNKPPQEGLYQHFSAIARETELPIILYNIPSRCVVNMEPETIIRLAQDNENIVAVKEAGSDFDAIRRVLSEAGEGFEYFSGNDETTLDMMAIGGSGVISTTGNVLPQQMAEMVHAMGRGDEEAAREMESYLMPLMKGLFATSNPILPKKALELLGHPVGGVRLPLVEADEAQTEALRAILEDLDVL